MRSAADPLIRAVTAFRGCAHSEISLRFLYLNYSRGAAQFAPPLAVTNMRRYLGTDPASEIARVRAREPDWFALADEVASYAGELIFHLKVPRGNELLLLSAVLYRRIAGSFEAVIALAERGMHTDGLATRRSLLEALFVLGAIHNQPALVQVHLLMDTHRRRDIFKNIKKLSPKLKNALPPELTPEIVDKTVAELELDAKGISHFGPEQYAQAAKLHDTYLTDYSCRKLRITSPRILSETSPLITTATSTGSIGGQRVIHRRLFSSRLLSTCL